MQLLILTKRRVFLLLGILLLILLFVFANTVSFFYFFKGDQRVNLAVLGVSGSGHDGSTLTDTVIFSSISSRGVDLISIPRDIWYVPAQAKINSLYYYGQKNGQGFELISNGIREVTGQKIDRWLVIDFNTFRKVIDWAGGIDVEVGQTFDDYRYPIAGKENDLCGGDKEFKCRYEHIHFEKGWQYMDGETTLKFVRSRNAEGDEGNDFARSKRQEKVIYALKIKILSPKTLFDIKKIREGWNIFREGVRTDLGTKDLMAMSKLFVSASTKKINSYVLNGWESENGLLFHPKTHLSGQWVLLPRNGSWDKVHQFVSCFIDQQDINPCSSVEK